jgi:ATP-dependent Clp protease ATP-binding subunit ClpC
VLSNAAREAKRFRHGFVGTEHVLLGLIKLGQGTAFTVLTHLGLNFEVVRKEIEGLGIGPEPEFKLKLAYTPRLQKVLVLAAKESQSLNHTYIGTEHLLLGLLEEGGGVAGNLFKKHGINVERTRNEVLQVLRPGNHQASEETG